MKILKRIGLFCCAVLLGIGAIFLPRTAKSQSFIANADSVTSTYDFDGSNLVTLACTYVNSSQNGYWSFAIFSFHLVDNENGVYCQVYGNILNRSSYDVFGTNQYFDGNFIATTTARDYNVPFSVGAGYNIPVYAVLSSSDFSCNIYKVRIYSRHNSTDGNTYWSFIEYYDVNNNVLTFGIRAVDSSGVVSNYMLDDRTYYFVTSDDLDDNQMYHQGYQDGLQAEQDTIYQEGRQDGFNGGYNQGYQEGVEAASNNNFFTMIGAAVDVPITALTSLLNFTFLGVNLLAFVTSILTLALIIFVIKKFMGKG